MPVEPKMPSPGWAAAEKKSKCSRPAANTYGYALKPADLRTLNDALRS
jgi:hypothetical protein